MAAIQSHRPVLLILAVFSRYSEAIEWARRAPAPHGEDADTDIEIRQVFELDDFAPSEAIDRARDLERQLGKKAPPPGR